MMLHFLYFGTVPQAKGLCLLYNHMYALALNQSNLQAPFYCCKRRSAQPIAAGALRPFFHHFITQAVWLMA